MKAFTWSLQNTAKAITQCLKAYSEFFGVEANHSTDTEMNTVTLRFPTALQNHNKEPTLFHLAYIHPEYKQEN